MKRLFVAISWALIVFSMTRAAFAKDEVVIHLDANAADLPTRLCMVLTTAASPSWCGAESRATCDEDVDTPHRDLCTTSRVVCSDGKPVRAKEPDRTVIVYLHGELLPPVETPRLERGGALALISVRYDTHLTEKNSFFAEVIGGAYRSGAAVRPNFTRNKDFEVTLGLVPRCVTRRLPAVVDRSAELTATMDGLPVAIEASPAGVALSLDVAASPGPHSVSLQERRNSAGSTAESSTVRVAEWRGYPPDELPFAYTTVPFSWIRHPLYGAHACPNVGNVEAGVNCRVSGRDDGAECRYECSSTSAFRLPLAIDLEKPRCDPSAPTGCSPARWADAIHHVDEKLDGFVPAAGRTIVVDARGWPTLRSPNRARTIELHFSNGESRELVFDADGKRSWYVIDAPNVDVGSTLRYDPRGERAFHEGRVTIRGEVVHLDPPESLTSPWSASLFAGVMFAVAPAPVGFDVELPSGYAIAGDGIVSRRDPDSNWALDLHLAYWLQPNRPYYPVSPPGAKLSSERTFQNRAAAAVGFSHYFSAYVAIHAEGGVAISWAVADAERIGRPAPAVYTAGGLRVRVLPIVWIEADILGFAPELFYRFDGGTLTGTPTRIEGASLSGGITFGFRIGNHTLQD